mmetsp:Transcript_75627/g.225433  ORF Transcript_75627/g.225433 Transcript_75627/m.225433 type:complete len:200 (+) Transcript_75627:536-1135(+)
MRPWQRAAELPDRECPQSPACCGSPFRRDRCCQADGCRGHQDVLRPALVPAICCVPALLFVEGRAGLYDLCQAMLQLITELPACEYCSLARKAAFLNLGLEHSEVADALRFERLELVLGEGARQWSPRQDQPEGTPQGVGDVADRALSRGTVLVILVAHRAADGRQLLLERLPNVRRRVAGDAARILVEAPQQWSHCGL